LRRVRIDIQGLGSTTFKRKDVECGFEADACFYLAPKAELIRGKDSIDLLVDAPPDIVVEVNLTDSLLDKDSIFAKLGVHEVWRYDGNIMAILIRSGEGYNTSEASAAWPFITAKILESFVSEGRSLSRLEWFKKVRAWARQQTLPA
jgi:Uma2 family endonuclease